MLCFFITFYVLFFFSTFMGFVYFFFINLT